MSAGRKTAVHVLAFLMLTLVTVGCSNDDAAKADTAQPKLSTSANSVDDTAEVPLSAAGIDRKTRRPDPNATAIALTNMSVTRPDGEHDQAVLTFTGAAIPGWAVQYVDAPIQNGTGQPFELPGTSWLEVLVLETPSPFTNPAVYSGPPVAFDNDTPQINTVEYSAQASGITQVFISLNGFRPNFAVSSLSDPTRIVIDVAD